MQRKSLVVALVLVSDLANSTQTSDELPPDAFREGFELDLEQFQVPAMPGYGDKKKWISMKDFRSIYQDESMPPYPWEQEYDTWVLDHTFADTKKDSKDIKTLIQTEAIQHTCTASIERIKKGPVDWKDILGSGKSYVDESFPHEKNEMVYWPSHPRRDNLSFKNFNVVGFAPPRGEELWGSHGVQPFDIVQGDVGDCYFLSSASALAEHPDRIKKLFLTTKVNKENIAAVEVFVGGVPTQITIDTNMPYKSSSKLMFGKISVDNAQWLPILEKVYAKISVNYEKMGLGWMSEAMRILTGAPSQQYQTAQLQTDQLWNLLKEADEKHYALTAAT